MNYFWVMLIAPLLIVAQVGLASAQAAPRFIDNGDGTVTDTKNGLMWAKSTGEVGGSTDATNVRNVNNTYAFSETPNMPDGSLFTEYLAALNNAKSLNGSTITGCFAKHCDWRIAEIDELRTIVDHTIPGCGFSKPKGPGPCIDPIFGPTQPQQYWSYTAQKFPTYGWRVDFKDGTDDVVGRSEESYARAVRAVLPPEFGQ
jgi:hypothetical protein